MHGANRLGTNSLLDLLVFGKSAGDSAVEDLTAGKAHRELPKDAGAKSLARIAALDNRKGGADVHETRLAMQRTMQNHAGVFRFGDLLKTGVDKILEVEKAARQLEIKDKSMAWNTARTEALEMENLIEVAKATMLRPSQASGRMTVRSKARTLARTLAVSAKASRTSLRSWRSNDRKLAR